MPFSKYSEKQKKLARVAPPRTKITKADFDALRKSKSNTRAARITDSPCLPSEPEIIFRICEKGIESVGEED